MKGENDNLNVLFSSIVEVLQQKEVRMLERMEEMERRIEELEEKLAQMQGNPVPVAAEDEIEIEFEFGEPEEVEEMAEELVEVEEVEEIAEVGEMDYGEDNDGLVMERAKPDWYDWEVDIPGAYIEDIWDGIGLNDRMLFLNELFAGDEEDFRETVSVLNGVENLIGAIEYIREKFPQWNEESDEVYRFYMTVRRRFNKQK